MSRGSLLLSYAGNVVVNEENFHGKVLYRWGH